MTLARLSPAEQAVTSPGPGPRATSVRARLASARPALLGTLLVGGVAATLRLVQIGTLGYNSDEAVYAGQAASLAGNPLYTDVFPVFRAHPLLSLVFRSGEPDVTGRMLVVVLGLLTVLVTYLLGKELYGRSVGLVAALVLAAMPYHVIVTRQVLLDGPMVLMTTSTLLLVARYARTQRTVWLMAAGGTMGLAMLSKETSIVLVGAVYAFLALTPQIKGQAKAAALALPVVLLVFATHPVSMALAGHTSTGKAYLTWQLLRRPNHTWTFYPENVPLAVGPLVVLAAASVWLHRRRRTWREVLLASWIVVPVVAFQLWPVKGFQYLLPAAPAVAVLAARGLSVMRVPRRLVPRITQVRVLATALVVVSIAVPSWRAVHVGNATTFLAGSGGVPAGREVGHWIAENTPEGAQFMTLGPSMANIVQFYGHRRAYGLSVSSNPLHRNPTYTPLVNADLSLRSNELQYVVLDSFTAARSPFFADRGERLIRRYHGRAVHTETVAGTSPDGTPTRVPVIIVYEVRP